MRIIENICYGKAKHPQQYLDIYLPEKESFKVFVYIHGGSLKSGDKAGDICEVASYLTEKGVCLVSINYRMYPKAVYPEFICDAAEAIGWVYKNIEEYGINEGIYIGGSSAGAYISMMLCFNKEFLTPYFIPDGIICGYIHDAGQPTTHFNVLKERGIDPRCVVVDEAAPIYHVGREHDYPPMLFIVSDKDIKSRYEQTQLMLSTLSHFGYNEKKILYKLMSGTHCHYCNTNEFGKIICDFLQRN